MGQARGLEGSCDADLQRPVSLSVCAVPTRDRHSLFQLAVSAVVAATAASRSVVVKLRHSKKIF